MLYHSNFPLLTTTFNQTSLTNISNRHHQCLMSYPFTISTYDQVASRPAARNKINLLQHHTNQQVLIYNSKMVSQNNRQVIGKGSWDALIN